MTESNVVPLANKRDWKWHRDRIAKAWGKQVESILETGQMLVEAKAELEHGSYEAMVQTKLPFGHSAARMIKAIAEHPILSNRHHGNALPASWRTLWELTNLPDEILMARLKDGSISPKLERKDVKAMKPGAKNKPKAASRDELIAAIQKDPNANQRDAAEQLGVSLGMYQRTRNELIGSGEIKGPVTFDHLREQIATLANDQKLTKEQRKDEIFRLMTALELKITDFYQQFMRG